MTWGARSIRPSGPTSRTPWLRSCGISWQAPPGKRAPGKHITSERRAGLLEEFFLGCSRLAAQCGVAMGKAAEAPDDVEVALRVVEVSRVFLAPGGRDD